MWRRPDRRGPLRIAMVLLLLVAALDLARGQRSWLRGWWSGLEVTRGEASRSWLDRARDGLRR